MTSPILPTSSLIESIEPTSPAKRTTRSNVKISRLQAQEILQRMQGIERSMEGSASSRCLAAAETVRKLSVAQQQMTRERTSYERAQASKRNQHAEIQKRLEEHSPLLLAAGNIKDSFGRNSLAYDVRYIMEHARYINTGPLPPLQRETATQSAQALFTKKNIAKWAKNLGQISTKGATKVGRVAVKGLTLASSPMVAGVGLLIHPSDAQ